MNTLENSCFQFQENDEASKECIRIMNERYKSASPSLSDNFRGYDEHYYSLIDGMKNCDKNDHSRNGTVIPATEYLALLTGKQLTEGDLIVGNRFECIETYHDGRINFVKGNIYPCNRNSGISDHRGYNIQVSMDMLNRHFKLLPTQESVKERNGDPSMDEMIQLVEQLESDKFHLQQQLKQAKELLKKTTSFCEDENMYPTVYHSINQFLTRNK